MRFVQPLAQAAARHRMPVTLGVECLDALAQPVETELRPDGDVGVRGSLDRQPARRRQLDDVGCAMQRLGRGHRSRELRRHAGAQQVGSAGVVGRALETASQPGAARDNSRTPGRKRSTCASMPSSRR